MKAQTDNLSAAFPKLKGLWEGADAGGMDWQIVRSLVTDSKAIVAGDCKPLGTLRGQDGKDKPNRYSSRTAALRASKAIAKKADAECSELGHWGGWKGTFRIPGAPKGDKAVAQMQLCLPIPRLGGDSEADSETAENKPAKPASKPASKPQAAKPNSNGAARRKPMTAEEKAIAAQLQAQSPAEIKQLEEAQRKEAAIAAAAS